MCVPEGILIYSYIYSVEVILTENKVRQPNECLNKSKVDGEVATNMYAHICS